jgi:hypothetical protein
MIRKILYFILFLSLAVSAYSQPKEFYARVDLIVWVVNDVQSVADGWKNIGFKSIVDQGRINLGDLTFRGQVTQAEIYVYTAFLGGAKVYWIQPLNGNCAYTEFLKENGDGVFALMHNVPLQSDLEEEIKRLKDLGVRVLQEDQIISDNQPLVMTYMQTLKKGKYALGFMNGPLALFDAFTVNNDLGMRFNQYAFAISPSSVERVSEYWEKLGFPAMEITHGEEWDKEYYGVPADFDMKLGWYRYGDIVYEWCIPLRPPTVYEDHIEKYGEGFQHLGFSVKDIDEAILYFEDKGFKVSMSGGWGEKGKPGSGRFAYVDTEGIGGETIELLWNYTE